MRKYELSISADYVPEWGTTEAIREYFQNSIDEETRDSSNKNVFLITTAGPRPSGLETSIATWI